MTHACQMLARPMPNTPQMPFSQGGDALSDLGLDALCDLVVERHHQYVRTAIRETEPLLVGLIASLGNEFPFLVRVLQAFRAASDELSMHMQREELELFPYIRRLEHCRRDGIRPLDPHFGSVSALLRNMEEEQSRAMRAVGNIRTHTSGYFVPHGAGTTFEYAYARLEHFEADLHEHIHLEHNILFPRAIILENVLHERN